MSGHKYEELAERLRNDIKRGIYAVESRLPSENELVKQTGYSRQTVRQAMNILERDNLTYRVKGSGTYVKDAAARRGTTCNIAVVTTFIRGHIFNDILAGICEVLSVHGYAPVLYATAGLVENERNVLMQLLEKPIDGIIIQGTKTALPSPNLDLYNQLEKLNIPVVFMNAYHAGVKSSVHVLADDYSGGAIACKYLVDRGHRDIACISKSDDMSGTKRYSGYADELVKENLPIHDDHVVWFTTETQNVFLDDRILSVLRGCTGVICHNDRIAVSTMKFLRNNGVRIPEEMEIVSFGNSSASRVSPVRFLSLEPPKKKLGKIAASKMMNILSGEKETSVLLPWKIPEDFGIVL